MLVHLKLPIFEGVVFTFDLEDIEEHYLAWRNNVITNYPKSDTYLERNLSFAQKYNIKSFIIDKLDWQDIAKIATPKIPMLDDSFESCFINEYDRIEIEFEEEENA